MIFETVRKISNPTVSGCYLRCKDIDEQRVFISLIVQVSEQSSLWGHSSFLESITNSFPWFCWLWSLKASLHCNVKAIERKL
jgi:hypothetical protein